jgi:AmiR/NasT family two-component response regulator
MGERQGETAEATQAEAKALIAAEHHTVEMEALASLSPTSMPRACTEESDRSPP